MIPSSKCSTQSVSPAFVAGIASHEASHRLVRSSYLFLVFTVSCLLVAESALLRGILVDSFLHFLVETGPASLKLLPLQPSDVFAYFLVKVQLLVIVGELFRSNFALEHFDFGLHTTFLGQSSSNRQHSFIETVVQSIFIIRVVPSNLYLISFRVAIIKGAAFGSFMASSKFVTKFLYKNFRYFSSKGPLPAVSSSGYSIGKLLLNFF